MSPVTNFKFITLGCKVNQYETQLMREQLIRRDLTEVNSDTPADLYIINTCTVTADTDRECRRFIRRCIKENPNAIIIAAGCYVEKDAEEVKAIDERIIILRNNEKSDIVRKIEKMGTVPLLVKRGQSPFFSGITHFKDHTKAFVKIQDGCDRFCSYCKVPYVRGAPRNRDMALIMQEAEGLIKNNYKELVLTGICLGAYGKLKDILMEMAQLDGDFRIRLSSIELNDITDGLIDVIKNSNKICRHLHIPLQSGDDEILKRMNRKYTCAEFIKRINIIKEKISSLAISTDVIVGFPGETGEAFKNTLNCIKAIKPMRAHIFSYSRRKGTAAYNLKPETDKLEIARRYAILKNITDELSHSYLSCLKEAPKRVLVERTRDKATNKLCGYSDHYVKILFDGPDELMGKFITTCN